MADLKFSKSTDTEHTIKLESHLVYATWGCGIAFGGQSATVEVGTAFVGNGAKIEIKGKSKKGKKLGKIKDVIKNNKYVGELEIPDDIEFGDEVYFEIKLSKNGLSGESDRVQAYPPCNVSGLKWSAAEAERGDVLTLSADVQGVSDGTEALVTIYEYDQDKAHDRLVTFPAAVKDERIEVSWEYEYIEDTDDIPDQDEMEEYGGSYSRPEYFFTLTIGEEEYGRDQESGLLKFKDWIEIECEDAYGEPAASADFKLILPDGSEKSGKLDSNGRAKVTDVAPGPCHVDLSSPDEEEEVRA